MHVPSLALLPIGATVGVATLFPTFGWRGRSFLANAGYGLMFERAALSILPVLEAPAYGQQQYEPRTQPDINDQSDTVLKDSAIAIEQGQLDLAKNMLDAVIRVEPDNVEANFLKGTTAEQEERWDDAVIFRKILEQHPEWAQRRMKVAHRLFQGIGDLIDESARDRARDRQGEER
jgi:Tfp pilus assembly protein PilF